MGPIWGRQDPGGPHVGPMNFAIWDIMQWTSQPADRSASGISLWLSGHDAGSVSSGWEGHTFSKSVIFVDAKTLQSPKTWKLCITANLCWETTNCDSSMFYLQQEYNNEPGIQKQFINSNYCQTSNIKHTVVANIIADHSDVIGALPVGAAPTTSSFLT